MRTCSDDFQVPRPKTMIVRLTDWLYQGDFLSVHFGEYKRYSIGAVICLNENQEQAFPESDLSVRYLWCPFDDPGKQLTWQKLSAIMHFAQTFQDEGVLVHCAGGANRSSVICALLLCSAEGMPEGKACALIREKNPGMNIRAELSEKVYALTGKSVRNP